MYHTKNQQLWNLISSIYEQIGFINPYNLNISSFGNFHGKACLLRGYRVDTFDGDNSLSLIISKEYSIVESKSSYTITLMKNGQTYRQTQQELIYKIVDVEIIPKLRDIKLEHLIADI